MILENITIVYGGHRVLESSTLHLQPGRVTALLGRNGTGKSSVFRALYGLYKDRNLLISVGGARVQRPWLRPGLINYLPQELGHPPRMRVAELVGHYGLALTAFLARYPLFTEWQQHPLRDLSHGTARLFVTLLVLEADTRYTVLDEPFSNVMPVHNELLLEVLQRVKSRKAILLSDHQYRTVLPVTDNLYLIADQRIRKLTDAQELIDLGYLREGTL